MLKENLKKIIDDHWQRNIQILSYQDLKNVRQGVSVDRVFLQESQRKFSVIIKAVTPEALSRNDLFHIQRFSEERFNYLFLSHLYPNFKYFPKLLAEQQHYFILEDLGSDRYGYSNQLILMDSLAQTLVELHTATADQFQIYQDLRQKYNVGENPHRKYGMRQYNNFFQKGWEQVKIFINQMGLPFQGIEQTIEKIHRSINDPGDFFAFVHGDMTSLRQSVQYHEKTFLFDFEGGKYAHALLDIAEALIGKFEYLTNGEYHLLNHTELPITFAHIYRQKREFVLQKPIEEKIWQQELGAALIYNTFRNLAVLNNVKFSSMLVGGFSGCVQTLCHRAATFLEGNQEYEELRSIFQRLACQTYVRNDRQTKEELCA